jgi:hypothetical protein
LDDNESDVVVLFACGNGLDDDGDGLVDLADPGCSDSLDNDESNPQSVIKFTNDPPRTAYVGISYLFDIDAVSSISNAVVFKKVSAPKNFVIKTNGEIEWLPLPGSIGWNIIKVSATDGYKTVYYEWKVLVESKAPKIEKKKDVLNIMNIRLNEGEMASAGNQLPVSLVFENNGGSNLDDLRITVSVPELGIFRRAGPFDLKRGETETKSVFLEIPVAAKKGSYELRITVGNDDIKRIKHRPIKVV